MLKESPAQQAPIPASHAITVALDAIDIEIEELMPEHMQGYGDLPEAAAKELNGIVEQLRGLTAEFDGHLRQTKRKRRSRCKLLESQCRTIPV